MLESTTDRGPGYESGWLTNHPLFAATLLYVVVAAPVFVWLVGEMGNVGEIDPYSTGIALALGAIMIVPVFQNFILEYLAEPRVGNLGTE